MFRALSQGAYTVISFSRVFISQSFCHFGCCLHSVPCPFQPQFFNSSKKTRILNKQAVCTGMVPQENLWKICLFMKQGENAHIHESAKTSNATVDFIAPKTSFGHSSPWGCFCDLSPRLVPRILNITDLDCPSLLHSSPCTVFLLKQHILSLTYVE